MSGIVSVDSVVDALGSVLGMVLRCGTADMDGVRGVVGDGGWMG